MKEGKEPVGNVHGHHHEISVSKVDDPHHTHDESHA